MLPLILWAIACLIEARLDTWVERYKLDLIDRLGVDIDTGKFWAYNPLRKGFSIFRDGWHTMKAVYVLLICVMVPLYRLWPVQVNRPWYIELLSISIAMVIIRFLVFEGGLKMFRK